MLVHSFSFRFVLFSGLLLWPSSATLLQARNTTESVQLRHNIPYNFRARPNIDRAKVLQNAAKFWEFTGTVLLWITWRGFNETAVDLNFGFGGLIYNLRKMTHVVTDPPLQNCHLIWALQTLAQVWYPGGFSYEVAVALDIFDRDHQWQTVGWLYLRDLNTSSASLHNSDAIATTSISDVDDAFTLDTTMSSTSKDKSKSGPTNAPYPICHYIELAEPVDRISSWYVTIQSVARIAVYQWNNAAGDEWRYDDDKAHLSLIWKRVEQVEAKVLWDGVKIAFVNINHFMALHNTWRETAADFPTFKGNGSLPLYGSVSLRNHPLPAVPNPQAS